MRRGFTLVEVMIVIVIMAILAAVVVPQFTEHSRNAKVSAAEFKLHELRSRIELYRQHHNGKVPSVTLAELVASTNAAGTMGTSTLIQFGPYCSEIPINPLTNSAIVRAATLNPPTSASGAVDAGWLYHASTGKVWIDDPDLHRRLTVVFSPGATVLSLTDGYLSLRRALFDQSLIQHNEAG